MKNVVQKNNELEKKVIDMEEKLQEVTSVEEPFFLKQNLRTVATEEAYECSEK